MMLITLGISTLLLVSSVLTAKADCDTPGWTPILSNPMQSSSGTIMGSTETQVSAVPQSINGGDGLKYMSTDSDGVSSIGEYAPGDATWSVSPGYPYDKFTDFFMFNYDLLGITCLLYIMPDGIYLAQQDIVTKEWSNPTQVITGNYRWPRGTIVAEQVWIAAQNVDDGTITVIFAGQLDNFMDRGPLSLMYDGQPTPITPEGQFAMFTGDTPGNPGLWFYWVNKLGSLPSLSYVENYLSVMLLSDPTSIGNIPFYRTISVSAIPSPDGYQALLVRTGYTSKISSQAYTVFTVVKIQDGQISQYCNEKTVNLNNNIVASRWAPALTADSLSAGGVTLTWVDPYNGGTTGALNSFSGNVWN
jgi:hypothetical protein